MPIRGRYSLDVAGSCEWRTVHRKWLRERPVRGKASEQ